MPLMILDLSEVIVRGLKGTEDALSHDLELSPQVIHRQFHEPELRELFLGQISEDHYWQTLLDRHHWNTTIDILKQRVRENMVELEGMFDLLTQLQQRGTQLSLLSNHTAPWVDHIEQRYPQLGSLIPQRFYSHQLHLAKPDPLAYRQVVDSIQRRPQDILFVDDHQPNLIGAATIGLRTLQFHTPHQFQQALRTMGYL